MRIKPKIVKKWKILQKTAPFLIIGMADVYKRQQKIRRCHMAQADFLCCTYFADVCYNGRGEKINNTYDEDEK